MKKIIIALISIMIMCLACFSVSAEENDKPVQTETQGVTQDVTQDTKRYDWSSNTTGNSNLVSDEKVLIDNGEYQFIAVSTYSDDVFYIIIDKTKTEDNVYFLNEVDTYDILKLVSDDDNNDDSTVSANSNNKSNNKNDDEQNPTSSDTETENNNTTSNEKPVVDTTSIIICIVLAAGGAGAFLFIKFVYGPKKQKQNSEIFEDDFEEERTINEDKE